MTFEQLPGEGAVHSDHDPGVVVPPGSGIDGAAVAGVAQPALAANGEAALAATDERAPATTDDAALALTTVDDAAVAGTGEPIRTGPEESVSAGIGPGFRPARAWATATVVLLALDAAFMAVTAAFSIASAAATWKFDAGIADVDGLNAIRTTVASFALLAAAGQVAAAISFLAWLHRSMTNGPALHVSPSRYSASWAIGSWFVPLVSFVVPYMVMADLRDRMAESHRNPPARWLFRAWWIAWLASAALIGVGLLTHDAGAYYAWAGLGWTAYFVAAVFALAVVRHVQRLADAREARLAGGDADADVLAARATSRRVVAVPAGFATAGAFVLLAFLVTAAIGRPAGPEWATFRSTAGRFAVSLPRVPSEVSETSESAVGPAVQHTFASALDAMEKYSVAYVDFRSGAFAATDRDALLDGLVGNVVGDHEKLSDGVAALGALPGRQVRVRMPTGAVDEVHVYLDGDRLYVLEADTTADRATSSNIARFFSSFTLQP